MWRYERQIERQRNIRFFTSFGMTNILGMKNISGVAKTLVTGLFNVMLNEAKHRISLKTINM